MYYCKEMFMSKDIYENKHSYVYSKIIAFVKLNRISKCIDLKFCNIL